MKAKHHHVAETADFASGPTGAERLSRILNDPQAVARSQRLEAVAVHRQAGQIHRQNGAGPWRDGGIDQGQVDVAGNRVHVHEDRPGAHGQDDVGGGDPA